MKFREGVFAVCPFCQYDRAKFADMRSTHGRNEWRDTRTHQFMCGAVLQEARISVRDGVKRKRPPHFTINLIRPCAGSMDILTAALFTVCKKWDLSTIKSMEDQEKIYMETTNLTALAIHRAIRKSVMMQDMWRLPPIPNLPSHVLAVARALKDR